jgi:hypothetical protein
MVCGWPGVVSRASRAGTPSEIRRVPADGSEAPTVLLAQTNIWEMVATSDRRSLVFRRDVTATGRDIFTMRLDSGRVVQPVVETRFDEKGLAVSPDGKWLAYSSDEAGQSDVYIRRLDGASSRSRVSQGGGVEPRWVKTGELFFRRGDSVMVTRPTLTSEPVIPPPRFVLQGVFDMSTFEPMWDVSPDGQRFAFVRRPDSGRLRLVAIVNWLDRVRRAKD